VTLLLLAITVGALTMRKTLACVFTGWFWFLIMLLPVLGIIQVGQQGHADRYTYLPQIGLFLAVTGLMNAAGRKFHIGGPIIATAALVILAASSWATVVQVGYWRDSELLWRHALAVTQNNDVAHANLADLLLHRGQIDEAIVHCEAALATRPRNADALNNLGLALWYKKQPIAAVSHYEASLAVSPHHLNAATNLAWILATFPDPVFRDGPRAVRLVEDVVRRSGRSNSMVLRTLAAAYAEAGRFPEAIEAAEQALQLARSEKNTALESDLEISLGRYHSGLPIRDSGAIGPNEVPRALARPP
jgi:tetratricopeptide (TPR) repeat protein